MRILTRKITVPAHLTGEARRSWVKTSQMVRAGINCAKSGNRRRARYWLNAHRRFLGLPKPPAVIVAFR